MITISGTLTNPSGAPLPFVSIFVKAVQSVPGADAIPESSLATYQTSSTGAYSFTLEEGAYTISISGGGLVQSVSLGSAVVNASSVDTDLITLVGTSGVPTNTILAAIDEAVTSGLQEPSGVTPGSYTSTNLTVDASGRITAAADGTGGDGGTTTVEVGTTTTGAPGTDAAVSNSGTDTAVVLNFTIPEGEPGADGSPGTDGSAATVSIGTTTTGDAGTDASVTNSGTSSAAILDFTIPAGKPGANGTDGTDGEAATVSVGTVTTGAAGSSAEVTNSGTSLAAILNFTIPQGEPGSEGPSGLSSSVADGTYTLASLTVNGSVITSIASGSITSSDVTTALGYTPVNNASGYTWAAEQTFSAAITVPDATADANPMTYGQGVAFLTGGTLSPVFSIVQCAAINASNSTTLAGTTSGQIIYDMPLQGSAKKLTIVFDGYENDTSTSQTITFPIEFTYQPAITFNNSGLTLTATTTGLTITAPDVATAYNGVIIVEGI